MPGYQYPGHLNPMMETDLWGAMQGFAPGLEGMGIGVQFVPLGQGGAGETHSGSGAQGVAPPPLYQTGPSGGVGPSFGAQAPGGGVG